MTKTTFNYSVFEANQPEVLSKAYALEGDRIIPLSHGALVEGRVIIARRQTMADFRDQLQAKPDHSKAFAYGTLANPRRQAKVVTQKNLHKYKGDKSVVSRTRDYFNFDHGPGIMMLDYDPPKDSEPMKKGELLQAVYDVCPAIKEAPHIISASASSFIFNGAEQVWGSKGWRIHILVANASDIVRAGEAFYERSWLKGYGYYHVGTNGSCHHRSLIDKAVFRPEGLDFVYGAACVEPLHQERPTPELINENAAPLNSEKELPTLSEEEKAQFTGLRKEARNAVEGNALPLREKWAKAEADKVFQNLPSDEQTEEKRRELVKAFSDSLLTQTLPGEFVLYPQTGGSVTVSEIMTNLEKWHDQRFADPLEPNYRNDSRIAWLNAYGHNGPYIHSHAHGGRRYRLSTTHSINVVNGKRAEHTEEALKTLRHTGRIFERGGEVVLVGQDGSIIPQTREGIQFILDEHITWSVWKTGKWKRVDAPPKFAQAINAQKGRMPLPALRKVITAPTIVPEDGRLIQEEGYDPATGIFFNKKNGYADKHIPNTPTEEQVKDSLELLLKPFQEYPLRTPLDRGGLLAAILTAVIRPALETAPGFMIDAPQAGSGKTKLAKSLAVLAGSESPATMPPTNNEEEMRKRILSVGREGGNTMLIDNIEDTFTSSALCTWLTSKEFADRELGQSARLVVPTQVLCLLTGNNLRVAKDLRRRMIRIHIDPNMEKPWERKFSFDPVHLCKSNRYEMNAAALTLIRAGGELLANKKTEQDFPAWQRLVRKTVCWVRDKELYDVEDPMLSINWSYEEDYDRNVCKEFFSAWFKTFGLEGRTLKEALNEIRQGWSNGKGHALNEIAMEIAAEGDSINFRKLGKWVSKRQGKVYGKLKLIASGKKSGRHVVWKLQKA